MRYSDVSRAMGGNPERVHAVCRTALIPYMPTHSGRVARVREQLRAFGDMRAVPGVWAVPRRMLKRWATRAAAMMPRRVLLNGPALAMSRRHVMHPSIGKIMP